MPTGLPLSVALAAACSLSQAADAADGLPRCAPMELPVAAVEAAPEQYQIFCANEADACDLTGARVLDWTEAIQDTLVRINDVVNREIEKVSDWERTGLMDSWDFPFACHGDCEDIALEKRRRLVEEGLPGAAFTLATAVHRTHLFPHAVLLAETTRGTFVLDDLSDGAPCWDALPYLYTRRERPDGLWTRFQLP